jgi:hypothetical protein
MGTNIPEKNFLQVGSFMPSRNIGTDIQKFIFIKERKLLQAKDVEKYALRIPFIESYPKPQNVWAGHDA